MATDDLLRLFQNLPLAEQQRLLALSGQQPASGSVSLPDGEVGGSVNTGYLTAGGDFAGRDLVKHIVNLYLAMPGVAQMDDADAFTKAIGRYLDWVAVHYGRLDLRGIQTKGRDAPRLTLDDVYVSLSVSLPPANPHGIAAGRPWVADHRPGMCARYSGRAGAAAGATAAGAGASMQKPGVEDAISPSSAVIVSSMPSKRGVER